VGNAASTDYLGILLVLSALVVFGGFAWGVRGHFVSAKMPIGMKLILALSSLGMVGYLLEIGNAGVRIGGGRPPSASRRSRADYFCGHVRRRDWSDQPWRFPGAIRSGCSTPAHFALFAILFICLI
jgi:hypothetical protein